VDTRKITNVKVLSLEKFAEDRSFTNEDVWKALMGLTVGLEEMMEIMSMLKRRRLPVLKRLCKEMGRPDEWTTIK
jgi:hypothetical protein